MTPADIAGVAALQCRVLEESLVTQLGERFLERFYRVAMAHDSSEAIVACDETDRVIGTAFATTDIERFNTYVTPRVAFALAASLLSRWDRAFRIAGSVFERKPGHIGAELVLLFVDAAQQRSGTGTRLVKELEERFRRRGIRTYRVSVRSVLKRALAFYTANGFVLETELTVLGRPMTYLIKSID